MRKRTAPLAKVDKKLFDFIKDLKETLKKQHGPEGLGIAANQVGADYRLFLAVVNKKEVRIFINPEVVGFSHDAAKMTEGCLSVPGLYSEIERPSKVKLKYQIFNNIRENLSSICVNPGANKTPIALNEAIGNYEGLIARVIQHEIDHLNGIVFLDHALRQGAPIYRIVKGKDGKNEFEEVKI